MGVQGGNHQVDVVVLQLGEVVAKLRPVMVVDQRQRPRRIVQPTAGVRRQGVVEQWRIASLRVELCCLQCDAPADRSRETEKRTISDMGVTGGGG